jgi:hypothetical protein
MTYQILLNEFLDYFLCYMGVRVYFYPFNKVGDDHRNEFMLVAHFKIDWLYDIQTLYIKRSRQGHIEQRCGGTGGAFIIPPYIWHL